MKRLNPHHSRPFAGGSSTQRRACAWAVALLVGSAPLLGAAADKVDASRLGTELSPTGAAKAASADGSIPAWAPVEAQSSGWTWGKRRLDHWRHKADKPLYSIDAGNVDKYADKLSDGQQAMLKDIKGYRMDVYPTRRTCGVPDFVAENTRKNVGFAKLNADGLALQEAHLPGFPFPMPSSGVEAMWNMKMRYRGVGVELRNTVTAVSPRKGASEWIKAYNELFLFVPWGLKGDTTFSKVERAEGSAYFVYSAPPALAGQAAVITTQAGQAPETFYYFPGQRRVRRMPAYAYDAPQIGYDNQYTMDEGAVFTGPLDRFDWKLVGKKEMLVPYNAFGLYDFNAKFDEVAQRDFIAPSHRRYELHRVWVVEATVRPGVRHLAPKRTLYLDEDSWNPLMAVDHDAQGKVWKVREGFSIPVFETGACDVSAFVQHNLADARYVLDFAAVGTGTDVRWVTDPAGNPRMKQDYYTSENLRAISDR